jgi:hypothetical protein
VSRAGPDLRRDQLDAVISRYDVLPGLADSPVARLNRAAAVAERDGPRAGLALVVPSTACPGTRGGMRPGRSYCSGWAGPLRPGHLRDRMFQLPPP